MKYKVLKGTELYTALKAIQKKCWDAVDAAKKLGESLGAKDVATRGNDRAGGIDAFQFSESPNKILWMQPDRHNNKDFYYPRYGKKYKENDSLHEQIKALPIVSFKEYNSVIGLNAQFVGLTHYRSFGLHIYEEYALIEVGEKCKYKPLSDMTEITVSQFNKLEKDGAK